MIKLTKISKFKRLFLEATAERDEEFRNEAQRMCDEIKNILKDQEYIKNNAQRNEQFQGYVLNSSYSKYWKDNHPNLVVAIGSAATGTLDGQKTELKGGYAKLGNGKHLIVVSMLVNPYDLKYADTRFPCRIFTHEFIHYLDKQRMQDPSKRYKMDTSEEYLNNPSEYNAHYQEAIGEVFRDIKSIIKLVNTEPEGSRVADYAYKKLHKIIDTYDAFEAMFIKKFGNDFDLFNDKYQKKIRKRLYGDWESAKKKVEEILAKEPGSESL